jgi:hypothetical protein
MPIPQRGDACIAARFGDVERFNRYFWTMYFSPPTHHWSKILHDEDENISTSS